MRVHMSWGGQPGNMVMCWQGPSADRLLQRERGPGAEWELLGNVRGRDPSSCGEEAIVWECLNHAFLFREAQP